MRQSKSKLIRELTRIFNENVCKSLNNGEPDIKTAKENKEKNRQMYRTAKHGYKKLNRMGKKFFLTNLELLKNENVGKLS